MKSSAHHNVIIPCICAALVSLTATSALLAQTASPATLTPFVTIPNSGALYHMTESPVGSFAIADFGNSGLYFANADGSNARPFASGFISPTSAVFFSLDVGFSTCNPAPFASRNFCLSGARGCTVGVEGVSPGNQSGVSNPRYAIGNSGNLTSPQFYVSNGGTGEILLLDPVSRSSRRIANGFSIVGSGAEAKGPEQLALNTAARQLYVADAGKNSVVAIDLSNNSQRVIRSGLNWPFGLILLANGDLLVANRGSGTLTELTAQGEMVATYDTGLGANALRGLSRSAKGDIYLVSDSKKTVFQVTLAPSSPVVATVHAASFVEGSGAGQTILSAFGSALATSTASATSVPLPTTLSGLTLTVTDGSGKSADAPLFFVSPQQINFLIPSGLAPGSATINVKRADGSVVSGSITLRTVAPGLFSADSTGAGLPAGSLARVRADGTQSSQPLARFDSDTGRFVAVPVELTDPTDQVALVLFGTGFRNRSSLDGVRVTIGGVSSRVLFAGPQGSFDGLDQLNVSIPSSLAGAGSVPVQATIDGVAANPLNVTIR